jgi:hypothetical protein
MHVPRRDHPDERAVAAQGEGDVQRALVMGQAQGVETRFTLVVLHILQQEQRLVEEHLLGFAPSSPRRFFLSASYSW